RPSPPAPHGPLPTLPAYIFQQARLPTAPQPTGLATNLAVAAVVGLILGVGGVLLADYLDITVRGIEEAERRLDLPVLGAIPELGTAPSQLTGGPTPTRQPRAARRDAGQPRVVRWTPSTHARPAAS